MFEMETRKNILERLKQYYTETAGDKVNLVEGGFAWDSLSANAKEFEKAYAEMALIIEASFPQTSWGDWLTKKAEEHGIIRQEATNSSVILTVTGQAGVAVSEGALFSTNGGKNFITVETKKIESTGTVDIKAQSQDVGTSCNVDAETITKIPMSIYGVSAVTNKNSAYDGFDEETDEELLERLLFKVRQPATSGNKNHYIIWATNVEGVGGVKVLPLWNGNGTVKVIITNAENEIATEDLIAKVQNYIDEQRPIGATVTVVSPKPLNIDIGLKVTKGSGNPNEIKNVVNDFFKTTAFEREYVSYAQVGKVILEKTATGVQDYSDLTLNNKAENIALTDEQLPTVGQVYLIE
jgi:uncharacterized phage protein gp47/JayE|nr:MAG TPA: Baseplate J like protein [Caudoviricetes sp.]